MEFKLLAGFRKKDVNPLQPSAVSTALTEVRAYWEGLRREGGIPARTDLDPRGISGALDRVFIAERIGKGMVRIRIAGSALAELGGVDLRGLPLGCIFHPDSRARLSTLVERVFDGPAAIEMRVDAERGVGRPNLDGRLLMLPLLDTDQSRTMILGCFAFNGEAGRAPRPLSIRFASEDRLAVPAQSTLADIRQPKLPAENSPAAATNSHLRLVYSAT